MGHRHYCMVFVFYRYWKKYADYEKRKGSAEDCEQVTDCDVAIHFFIILYCSTLFITKDHFDDRARPLKLFI